MNRLLRKVRVFLRLPLFERLWLCPAWCLLGLARAAVLVLPFRMLAARLGDAQGVQGWIPLATPRQMLRARGVGRVVRMAARFTPWDSNCLAQALAASALLRLYGVPCATFLGVKRDSAVSGAMLAHAWVHSGTVIVSGGIGVDRYTAVACFTSPRGSAQPR